MSRVTLDFARQFGRLARELPSVSIADLASMCRLKDRIGTLTYRETGGLTKRSQAILDNARGRLEQLAASCGFRVDFSNPYPTLYKGNQHVDLPV